MRMIEDEIILIFVLYETYQIVIFFFSFLLENAPSKFLSSQKLPLVEVGCLCTLLVILNWDLNIGSQALFLIN